ncbi:MAG: hypothetical protein LBS04_04105 [Tannerellaceae bacterium]|jgi:hypothetical protein|nr:hypothetical protein [Tannerellaceae bacterium]
MAHPQVVIHKLTRTIFPEELQITFASSGKKVRLFTTVMFTMPMLDDLEQSKIVQVEGSSYSDGMGWIAMSQRFGYSDEKFTNVLFAIIDKFDLNNPSRNI